MKTLYRFPLIETEYLLFFIFLIIFQIIEIGFLSISEEIEEIAYKNHLQTWLHITVIILCVIILLFKIKMEEMHKYLRYIYLIVLVALICILVEISFQKIANALKSVLNILVVIKLAS